MAFDRFCLGEVNRARENLVSAGGKAVNTGLALARLRRACVITGLNGGDTGRFLASYLAERGVRCAFTVTPWPTRTCTTILDRSTGCATELVEEAHPPTPELLRRFETRGCMLLRRARAVVISGTIPPGVPEDIWLRFARVAQRCCAPLLIDSHGAPLVRALAGQPVLARMNVCELEKTFAIACRTEACVVASARRLTAAGAAWALITQGPQPAVLVSRAGEAWRVWPPAIGNVVSPIGSGDCVNAGVVHALLKGTTMPEAACLGLACGSAKALTSHPADFSPATARTFAAACRVERIRVPGRGVRRPRYAV